MNILSLPTVMIEHVFSFLSYDQIARVRLVCKDFDAISQRSLNRGFQMIERRITSTLKAIKCQLPRRESERRFHRLAKHCDILTSVETRLSMLKMTYNCFILQGKCCFIPGKILDELNHIMSIVDKPDPLPMAFEVLQELRDISGMAIEHFEEFVGPTLRSDVSRQRIENFAAMAPLPALQNEIEKKGQKSPVGTSLKMVLLRETCVRNHKYLVRLEKKFHLLSRKLELYKRLMTISKRQLIQKQIEQSYTIADLKKKVEEYEVKFKEVSATTGYKNYLHDAEKSPSLLLNSSVPPFRVRKNFGSQIKLDPSLNIGYNRGRKGSPIIKPRRASLVPPGRASGSSTKSDNFSDAELTDIVEATKKNAEGGEASERYKSVSKNSKIIVRKRLDHKNFLYGGRLSVLRKSQAAAQNPLLRRYIAKKMYKLTNAVVDAQKNDGDNEAMMSLPGTSKSSDDSEDVSNEPQDCADMGDDPHDQGSHRFQTKVQLLSRTIMKLIESMSDASEAKKKRTENI